MLTKQEILLGKGSREESSRVRRTALAYCLGFYGDGISFRVVFSQSFFSESFLVVHPCSAKVDAQKDSGRWSDMWRLLLTFPELSWLVVAY